MKMNKMLKLMALLGAFILAVGCAGPTEEPSSSGADQQAAASAIAAAKSAQKRAGEEFYEWRDTGKIIKKAEDAMKKGNYDEAVNLANKARRQSENALKQKKSEIARLTASGLLEGSKNSSDNVAATGSMETAGSYEVERGDNLWDISGKSTVYGNPFQWPLIYKANSDKIKDADLIYPGQVFGINTDPSNAETTAAINHAKTRGSWSLGTAEESDKAYLTE